MKVILCEYKSDTKEEEFYYMFSLIISISSLSSQVESTVIWPLSSESLKKGGWGHASWRSHASQNSLFSKSGIGPKNVNF